MKVNHRAAARMRARAVRATVAGAFRRLARGVAGKVAYARTVGFYRSKGKIRALTQLQG